MAVDPYQPCPCGSGKKIKFCCSDLIGEMEKIYRMIEGDQPRAALRHVEQTLAKHPGRSSLLDLQAVLQFSLGQNDQARATIGEFLKADPKSPIAHAQDAMAKADARDTVAAVEAWQRAIDLCEESIPARVHEALGAVAMALVQGGHLLAARAHLWLFQAMAPDDDHRALELLAQMNASREVPLLLRDPVGLRGLPADHPAAPQVAKMAQLARNGRWHAAAELCDDLLPDHLDQPLLFYDRALLSGFLADRKNCVAGLRLYARQPIAVDDAVEAEALAQLLDEESHEPLVQDHAIEYALVDEDGLLERLQGHKQVVPLPLLPEHLQHIEGPKPRNYFLLLDRPVPDEAFTLDNQPREVGSVSHYGRQTDRAERLELVCEVGAGSERAIKVLEAMAGDLLGSELGRHDHAQFPHDDFASLDTLYFGSGYPASGRKPLLDAERRAVLRAWLDKPRRVLAGKTPRDAAAVEELRLSLMACLFNLEQQLDDPEFAGAFAEIRQELQLPAVGSIDGSQIQADLFPLVRIPRLELSTVSDDALWRLYTRANMVRALSALRLLTREILRRPDGVSPGDKGALFHRLVQSEADSAAALGVIDEAREWAESQGESTGPWDLLELQLHIGDNNPEAAEGVMAHLREEHLDEPEVAYALYRLLAAMGALPGRGGEPHAPHAPHLEPAGNTAEGRIWTPGGETPAAGGSSKIWIPD